MVREVQTVGWDVKVIRPGGETVTVPVTDGSLDWAESRSPMAGGRFSTKTPVGSVFGAQIQPIRRVNGEPTVMGDYIATADPKHFASSGEWSVEFIDRSILASNTRLIVPLSLPRSTHVVTAIRARLSKVGLAAYIDDQDDTLRTPIAWDVGTSELKVINDLLEAINYHPLRPVGMRLQASEYRDVTRVDPEFSLREGVDGTHLVDYAVDSDHLQVANRIVGVTAGGDGTPVLRALATDQRTTEFSHAARGGFWMDPEPLQSNATTQAVLEAQVWRELRKRQSTMRVTVQHQWDPAIVVGAVGTLSSTRWGELTGTYEVVSTGISMKFNSLASSELRRIQQ